MTENGTEPLDGGAGVWTAFVGDPAMVAKASAVIALGLGAFLLGVLPVALNTLWNRNRGEWSSRGLRPSFGCRRGHDQASESRCVSLLLSFGGGVLLYTAAVHILAEVRESVVRLQRAGRLPGGHSFEQLGDLIFFGGFFSVFLLDEIAHAVVDRCAAAASAADEAGRRPAEPVFHRSRSLRRRSMRCIPRPSDAETGEPSEIPMAIRKNLYREYGDEDDESASDPSFGGLFAVLALSFHEVFEGIVIGLETDAVHVWSLIVAVALHKLIIAFCVGMELVYAQTNRALLFLAMATFAAVTPTGIGIGLLIFEYGSDESGTSGPVSVILQGLAAGTLLYVVFFEVLARHKQSGFLNLFFIVLGFGLMWIMLCLGEYILHRVLTRTRPVAYIERSRGGGTEFFFKFVRIIRNSERTQYGFHANFLFFFFCKASFFMLNI